MDANFQDENGNSKSGRKFNVDDNDNTKIDKITGHIKNCEPSKQLKIVNVVESSEISKTFESNNMSKTDIAPWCYRYMDGMI